MRSTPCPSKSDEESVDIASTAATAAGYSPLSGLITDNNYNQYVRASGFPGGGIKSPSFTNPNAPTTGAGGVPAGAPGSITGAGAYTPDWASLIKGDAGLNDAQAALAAGGAANQTALDSQLANAYESFGKNVDLNTLAQQLGMSAADLQTALGPEVQRLAQENTNAGLSTTARLDKANQDAIRQITANLNRRGILHSGEAGYQLDQQNLGYRQASSDAYQKLLGYLQQYQQGYLSAQQQNAQSLAGAYSSAADRVYNNNQSTPGATADYAYTDASGNHVYKGPDGQLYNLDGSVYTPPAPVTPDYVPATGLHGGGPNVRMV